MWYYKTVGNSKCPIVDTWWQTETGGILIAPQTGAIPLNQVQQQNHFMELNRL